MSVPEKTEPRPFEVGTLGTRCQRLLRYWHSLHEVCGGVPERDRFDPIEIPHLLPHIHLMEWRAPDDIRYRLSGTEEVARLGSDPKGSNYFDAVDAGACDYLRHHFHRIMQHPAGILISTEETYSSGTMRLTRFIGLPLMRRATGEDFTVCVVETDDKLAMPMTVGHPPTMTLWWDRVIGVDTIDLGYDVPHVPPFEPKAGAA